MNETKMTRNKRAMKTHTEHIAKTALNVLYFWSSPVGFKIYCAVCGKVVDAMSVLFHEFPDFAIYFDPENVSH